MNIRFLAIGLMGAHVLRYLVARMCCRDVWCIAAGMSKRKLTANASVAAICISFAGIALASDATMLQDRMNYWRNEAYLCSQSKPGFPSSETGEVSQPCNDGDMTLFNGLLCLAGEAVGCDAVRDAQDSQTGEWHRSPRIRALGYNDRGDASFSPDMALGVQLYALRTRDVGRFNKWLLWMHEHVACAFAIGGSCLVRALPRFCTNDAPNGGCTVRPGDAATLSATIDYLQRNAGLPTLPDGRLRGHLSSFNDAREVIAQLDSILNKPGYSQHIFAVGIWVMRNAGVSDSGLNTAITRVAQKEENRGNAFFTYLAGDRDKALKEVLARCPSNAQPSKRPVNQWQWERDNSDKAWERSNYWDCIFMGRLLGAT